MGVTIHYRGVLNDESALSRLLEVARAEASRHGWVVGPPAPGKKGLVLFPHGRCDPLSLEFEADLTIENFVKPQFAPIEIHVSVIDFLRRIVPLFAKLEVLDEGDYWELSDLQALTEHRKGFTQALTKFLTENPGASGPVMLSSGRWVDVLE